MQIESPAANPSLAAAAALQSRSLVGLRRGFTPSCIRRAGYRAVARVAFLEGCEAEAITVSPCLANAISTSARRDIEARWRVRTERSGFHVMVRRSAAPATVSRLVTGHSLDIRGGMVASGAATEGGRTSATGNAVRYRERACRAQAQGTPIRPYNVSDFNGERVGVGTGAPIPSIGPRRQAKARTGGPVPCRSNRRRLRRPMAVRRGHRKGRSGHRDTDERCVSFPDATACSRASVSR